MQKHEVWAIYARKNPKFTTSGSNITFTEVGIYQFFERTWDLAHSEGVKNGKALAEMNKTKPESKPNDTFRELFGDVFK
jgi:hypothetical protein